jgi:signal transduction histidine kinase
VVGGRRPLRDIPLESFSWLFEKLREGDSLHAPDVAAHIPEGSSELAWLRERGFQAAILVPAGVGEKPSALFTLIALEPRVNWSGDSIPTFRILGEMIVNARERRRQDEERQQRDRATRLIADLSTALVNLPTEAIDTAIDEALEKVGQLIGSDGCAMFRSNETHTRARLTHVWSPEYAGRRNEYSIVDLRFVAKAYARLRAGETIAVPDCTVLGSEDPALETILTPFGVRSLALVPMTLGGELVGLGGYVWMQQQRSDVAALDPMLRLLGELIVNAEARKRSDDTLRQLNASLEERVQERTAQLQAINREMSSFSYSVSHDLRLPLRSINGYTHILREEHGPALSAEASALLDEVSRASRRMGELIDALLSLSRISRSEFHAVRVNLSALAEEIAARLRRSAPERNVTFDIAPGLEATGEPRLLAIAMENLLQNAWKFTSRKDTATIELGVAMQNEAPAFYVRDNGAGFDPRHRAKLFGTFQRLHRSDEFEGHGVGLASVQRIVKLHGGEIWAEGAIDCGATFWFTLPAR